MSQAIVFELPLAPIMNLNVELTVEEAVRLLSGHGCDYGALQVQGKSPIIVKQSDLQRAMRFGFADVSVQYFPSARLLVIDSELPLNAIFVQVINEPLSWIVVVKGIEIVGTTDRTSVLTFYEQSMKSNISKGTTHGIEKTETPILVSERVRALTEPRYLAIIDSVSHIAEALQIPIYLFGGFVRDVLLGISNKDLDFAVDGDSISVAKHLAGLMQGEVHTYPRFQTATVSFSDGITVDIARLRQEQYEAPARLPIIAIGKFEQDVLRRDFTINAMALSMHPKSFGTLSDLMGGVVDLRQKRIRILHGMSFIDDPTRIFRAIRFEQRFNFKIEAFTLRCVENALTLSMFKYLTADRLYHEFELLCYERHPVKCLKRLDELGVMEVIIPGFHITSEREQELLQLEQAILWSNDQFNAKDVDVTFCYILFFVSFLEGNQAAELAERFGFSPPKKKQLLQQRQEILTLLRHFEVESESHQVERLVYMHSMQLEPILIVLARSNAGNRTEIVRYLTNLRSISIETAGADLKELGFLPGPLFKQIKTRLLAARLSGEVHSKAEEMQLIRTEFGTSNPQI